MIGRLRKFARNLLPGERERLRAFARLAESEDGQVLIAWLRSLKDADFGRYRASGESTALKAEVDGAVDRTALILLELEGARAKWANSPKERK